MTKLLTYHRGDRNFGTGHEMIDRIKALEAENQRLREENERWRDVAKWYDDTVEKHVTPTGKPARISDKNGVWHDGPAAEMAHKILRGLQNVLRATLLAEQEEE